MPIPEKRDFREETYLNAAEESLLIEVSGFYGVSKAAALRMCLHIVGDDLIRKKIQADRGNLPGV